MIKLTENRMVTAPQVREYIKYIANTVYGVMPVSAIYLFGSHVSGTLDEFSDLDIYIVTPDKSKRRVDWAIHARKAFGTTIKMPIDVVVNYEDEFERRSKIEMSFEHEVATKGVLLFLLASKHQKMQSGQKCIVPICGEAEKANSIVCCP